jgi:hypothetical protein
MAAPPSDPPPLDEASVPAAVYGVGLATGEDTAAREGPSGEGVLDACRSTADDHKVSWPNEPPAMVGGGERGASGLRDSPVAEVLDVDHVQIPGCALPTAVTLSPTEVLSLSILMVASLPAPFTCSRATSAL